MDLAGHTFRGANMGAAQHAMHRHVASCNNVADCVWDELRVAVVVSLLCIQLEQSHPAAHSVHAQVVLC